MTKIHNSAPPAVHSSAASAPSEGVKGSAPAAPAPGAPPGAPLPSSPSKAPGQTSQFSAPKPKYSDPYAKGKPPSPEQQAAYTTSTKSVGYGGSTKAPQFTFLKQPKTHPDNKLCAFYALHHFSNGSVGKQDFFDKALKPYTDIGMNQEDAKAMMMDGNDPAVLGQFDLKEGSDAALQQKGVGIIADTTRGHFFTVRKEGDKWVSYDSFNHDAPKKYDSFEALKKAEIGNHKPWVGV